MVRVLFDGQWIGPVGVGARGAFENTQIDHGPDEADNRDQQQQTPPAGFVAVVAALHRDGETRIEQRQLYQPGERTITLFLPSVQEKAGPGGQPAAAIGLIAFWPQTTS